MLAAVIYWLICILHFPIIGNRQSDTQNKCKLHACHACLVACHSITCHNCQDVKPSWNDLPHGMLFHVPPRQNLILLTINIVLISTSKLICVDLFQSDRKDFTLMDRDRPWSCWVTDIIHLGYNPGTINEYI